MKSLPLDLDGLCDALRDAASEILESSEDRPGNDGTAAELLASALRQLFDVLKRVAADRRAGENGRDLDPSELCDYGLQLIGELAQRAAALGAGPLSERVEQLAFPYALWMARHGAELRTLEPVVNALATIANRTSEPADLEALCSAMGELIDAVAPPIRQDIEATDPGRPWRLLNLNRGIVATRSHNPALMDAAFRVLTNNLPEEAPEFFREGMAQMNLLDYPAQVRKVMERYYQEWTRRQTLH
jgi:hypothetical protein